MSSVPRKIGTRGSPGRFAGLAVLVGGALVSCAGPPDGEESPPASATGERRRLRADLQKRLRKRATAAKKEAKEAEPLGEPSQDTSRPSIRRPLGEPLDLPQSPRAPGELPPLEVSPPASDEGTSP